MLFIFDLDGTLVDSLVDLREATEYALSKLGYPGHELDPYRFFVGNGVKNLILRALPSDHQEDYEAARSYFDEYYEQHCLDNTPIYPGLKELVCKLKNAGHYVGVNTNKPDALAKKICAGLFGNLLDFVYGQVDDIPIKPDPYFALKAIKDYNTSAIFIGDSNVDMMTGQNANIPTIGVTWGNRSEDELRSYNATYIAHDASELEAIIKELLK